jgi:RNA polymerase sigma-70 factor (ECF subfamily)
MAHHPAQDGAIHEALEPLNEQAVSVLLENHRKFRAFLGKRVGSDAFADDLLQQSLKKALEHPAMAREETSILAWFYHILRSALVDHYRSRAAEEKKATQWVAVMLAQGETHIPAVDETQAALCACFTGLLPTLKPSYAELIQRIDLQEESVATVARDLGITEKNLYVRLHRARQALKVSLERACGTCTEHGCLHCTCA